MTFRDVAAPIRSIPIAVFAGFILFVMGALSILSINIFGYELGFGFVPLLVLLIWPRRANEIVSLILVFLAGIFTDWGTAGAIGQSSLVYIVTWALFRPELRVEPYAIRSLIIIWGLIGLLVSALILGTGLFIYRVVPDVQSLFLQFILASLIIPIFLLLRFWIVSRFINRDEWMP